MLHNKIEAKIKVKGRTINEYFHEGEHFVEGRGGSNYEIEITNHSNERVEAIISVDGLSVVDGKEAGPNSSGFIIGAGETETIPGWMVDSKTAAAFMFSDKKNSYAATATNGSTKNNGVIGVMAFSEKAKPRHVFLGTSSPMRQLVGSSAGVYGSNGPSGDAGWNDRPRGICASSATLSSTYDASINNMSIGSTSTASIPEVEQTLGTGFGSSTDFATHTVTFERGDMVSMIVLYYDNAKGLRARGIDLDRRKSYSNAKPSAFPALAQGCTPPPGWKG